jgi:hypothetical protein
MNYVDYVRIKRICCLLTFLPVMLAVCAMDFVSRHTGLDESFCSHGFRWRFEIEPPVRGGA